MGFEDTEHYVKETYAAENFNHQAHLREVTQRLFAGSEMNLEDEEASDEVSWMSAGVQQDQGELQPFLNRDAARAVDMPEVARQGDEVEMEIETEISPSDPEDGSGSETESSEGQEERHSTLAYFMDYDPVHCRPRWRTYELLHQDIAYQARMSHHDVSRIHIVGHPPEDLQMASVRPVIEQQPQDVTEGSTFQLILLDVEFHNAMPSLDAETVRRAKLLPKTISRKALLAVLGLQPFCTYARQACLMWHNRKPVKMQGRALIDLRHGDYLKVVVPPGRGELRKYYTREVAQCMRRGYRASNIPVILEANPEGIDVTDMPVYDTFAYVPKPADLDYDKDAMALFQMPGHHVPPMDPWPSFLTRSCEEPIEEFISNLKVGERDRQEARSYETSNGTQPEVGRPQLAFGNEQHFLQEFFPVWHHFAAVEREDEGRILYARTWYSDHDRFPACEVSRSARLTSDISSWLDVLAETWDDRVDPDAELDFYLIVPRPRGPTDVGDAAVPHVLIVQHPRHDSRSVHVFAVDATDAGTTARSFVTVMPFPLRKSDFLDLLGIRDETFIESLVDCAVWHGDVELDHVQQYNIRHGLSFIVILNHLRDIIARAARTPTASSSSTALLQVHQQRRVILLDELISEDEPVMQTGMVAVRVKWLASSQPSPSYITLSAEATHDDAAAELACWGLKALPVLCNECGVVVCLSAEPCETLHYDYVFVNTAFHGGSNMQDVIGHTDRKQLQTNELMSVLYQLGFWRAIIASEEEIYPSVFKVCFLDQVVTINEKPHKPQKNVDWPKPQPTGEHTRQPFFHDPSHTESDQLVDLGVQTSDLHELFLSHQDLLCLDFVGYELPEELQAAVDQCDPSIPIEEIDRFLVYTDGSSLGSAKHAPPMRAEEDGTGDTWAYVIVGERYAPPGIKFMGWTAQQVHYDPTSNAHLGAKRIGADIAEKEALSWATLWRLSFNQKTPTCFRSDSRVALGQAAGTTGAAEMDETFAFLRGAFQAIEAALGRDGVQYQHVPGHAGEAWNEICDWLAKRERQRSFYCPRPRMDMRKWKAAMSHLWLIVGQHADLPRFCGKGLHAPAPQLPQQHDPAGSEDTRGQTTTQQWDLMEFTVSACSVNVNSLSGAPEGHGGRLDYLRSQFAMLGFNFLGVQESKTPEFHSCVNQVLRMSSGHQNHQQGVELWINLAQPYGSIQGRPQFFDRHDFQVVYKSPRSLLVSVDTRFWRCWLLVAYAPHSGISHAERAQWWHTLSEALHHKPATDPLIVMLDANAGPGDYDGVAVHQTGFATSSGTSLLRSFAEEQGLFFPCTTTAHVGPTETWTDPTGEKSYCIDYVLLTHHFRGQCHLSRVVEEFDLGRTAWDHEATAVELQWQEWLQRRSRISPDGLGFDPEQINGQTVHSVLSTYAPPTWETNIEAHVGDFNKVLLQGLRQHCPPPRRGPKKAYMTEQSWQLRGSKLKFKKQIQQLFRRQRDERMIFFFKLWRHRRTDQKVWEEYQSYSEYLWRANFKLVGQHRKAMLQLRQHLSKAKQETIRLKFAEMDPNAPASAILHELKPLLGPSNLKKLKVSPLPQIRNAHGEACCLPNEAVEAWLEFFRQMEGGTRMDRRQQRDLWIANLQRFRQQEFHVQAEELPRLIDLEAAYRRINPYKAVGPDKLHPAFCRMNPSFLARLTFSQLWKLTLHGQEALDHKGGMLFPIWKSKGPKDCCTSYRSILVSSFIGKSLHRSLRQRQTALFERYMQTEQLGGRPKAPVTLGVHLGRAFLRARRSQGHNVAMLYLDLTEAFYRILRPLVTGGPVSDEMVMHVGRKLGFTEDLLEELYKHLSEPAAIAEANLPKHMQIAITALHEDTFFTVKGQGDVCRTTLGSRPGDCFADVIFSYLWGRILRRLQVTLTDMQIDDKIPADTGLSLSGPQSESSRSFLGPTWMDDTCVCVSDPSPQRLEAKIHQATGRLLDLCETHGLSPNLSPGKTEALLVFQGRGSRQMRIRYFGPTSDRSLKIMGEKGIMKVRAVAQYTHLGCVIHHQSDQRREARRRIGMAHQTFTQHRRHLLQNPVLSMQRRFELFKSLVWSRLSYGTETWTFSEGRTKEYIHNAVMRLLRRLLGRAHDAHLMDDDILTEVGANSPTELLRLSRLRYLGTLHKCTHLVPWGLINSDQQWIELIKDDLRWLWMQLHGSSQLPDPLINMAVWEDIWLHHPSYWRRLVRRGGEHAILQRRRNHRVVQFHHRFTQVFESVHPGSFARQAQANEELPEAARLEEQHACMKMSTNLQEQRRLGSTSLQETWRDLAASTPFRHDVLWGLPAGVSYVQQTTCTSSTCSSLPRATMGETSADGTCGGRRLCGRS